MNKDVISMICNVDISILKNLDVEKIKYDKWNGSVPQVQGSSTPIIDMTE